MSPSKAWSGELATPHSITSSAVASSVGGKVNPKAVGEGTDTKPYATTDLASRERLATRANSFAIQFFGQVSDRPQLEIAPENQPHSFGFPWDDDELFVDAGIPKRN